MSRENWIIEYYARGTWMAQHKHAERSYSCGEAGDVDAPVTLWGDTREDVEEQVDEWEEEHS